MLPLLGFLICLYLWLACAGRRSSPGGLWLAAGILYGAIQTRGFQRSLVTFDAPQD